MCILVCTCGCVYFDKQSQSSNNLFQYLHIAQDKKCNISSFCEIFGKISDKKEYFAGMHIICWYVPTLHYSRQGLGRKGSFWRSPLSNTFYKHSLSRCCIIAFPPQKHWTMDIQADFSNSLSSLRAVFDMYQVLLQRRSAE